jgi:hypothetical protein
LRRRKKSLMPVLVAGVVLAGFTAIALLLMWLAAPSPSLEIKPIAELQAMEGKPVATVVQLQDPDPWQGAVSFRLLDAPEGAELDAKSGRFTWTPSETQAPGRHEIRVSVTADNEQQQEQLATFWIAVAESNVPPDVTPVEDLSLDPGEPWQVTIEAVDPDQPPDQLRFALRRAPKGATIDETTGQLNWTPSETDAGKTVSFVVRVSEGRVRSKHTEISFNVAVTKPLRPRDPIIAALQNEGLNVFWKEDAFQHSFQGSGSILIVDGEETRIIEYTEPDSARQDAIRIAGRRESVQMPELPDSWAGPTRYLQRDNVLLVYGGLNQQVYEKIAGVMGESLESDRPSRTGSNPLTTVEEEPEQFGPFTLEDGTRILELYENGQLFKTRQYAQLREIFARRFQREHQHVLEEAWAEDTEAMMQWLDAHADIKQELFTAIDPATDDTLQVLTLFKTLWEKFPDHLASYGSLAIAVSVTWDSPKAVYRYVGPQRQGKAIMPDELATAEDNFAYYVNAEKFMEGRTQLLPWEFLVHVANHTTPIAEREWALQNYLATRTNYGSCYKDVPYDHDMLESNGTTGRIHGKLYTLPNIRTFGGVCAHQADFAARVGKSLGVPAASVGGKSVYGEAHAWVMWVELKTVNAQGIGFALESYGRYRGDKYYVGGLTDPKTGNRMTDRQLELSLHTVGLDPLAKRHSDRVMELYPLLCEDQSLDAVKRFLYLRDVVRLCPGNESAWQSVAKMSSDEVVRKKHKKDMLAILNQLFTTFANFPDFTLTVFEDLIQFETEPKQRISMWQRLVTMYEAAGRPDLACEARLRLSDLLVENSQQTEAIQGLAFTINRFPEEGRYVPRMLDRLEEICAEVEGAGEQLTQFYHTFLPMIPKTRGSRPSKYCIQMFERAVQKFQEAGQPQVAQMYAGQLELIRAGKAGK